MKYQREISSRLDATISFANKTREFGMNSLTFSPVFIIFISNIFIACIRLFYRFSVSLAFCFFKNHPAGPAFPFKFIPSPVSNHSTSRFWARSDRSIPLKFYFL